MPTEIQCAVKNPRLISTVSVIHINKDLKDPDSTLYYL